MNVTIIYWYLLVDNKPPIPYILGMIVMGVLVLFVVVFDAMLCARKEKGVLYCATRSCHKSNNTHDDNDNKQGKIITSL